MNSFAESFVSVHEISTAAAGNRIHESVLLTIYYLQRMQRMFSRLQKELQEEEEERDMGRRRASGWKYGNY